MKTLSIVVPRALIYVYYYLLNICFKQLNVKWLRNHIGIVGQEPVLFDRTIRENIKLGRDDASDAEIEEACKNSNAQNFVTKLPKVHVYFISRL